MTGAGSGGDSPWRMDIVLKNNTKAPKRMLVFNLADKSVKVSNVITVESRDGERRQKLTSKLVPDSIRIPCGLSSEPLPSSVLEIPEIKRAVEARDVLVEQVPEVPAVLETPATPAPSSEGKVRSRRSR